MAGTPSRNTKGVDFLVGAEAFHHHASGLVTMRPEIKGGIDTKRCREYLAAHASALLTVFDECVVQADQEQD